MIIHRLSKARFQTRDIADMGIGAALNGGRWNSRQPQVDRRVVYTSAHLSLALLEVLVHVGGAAMRGEPYVRYTLNVDDSAVEELALSDAGTDWRVFSETPQSQDIGDGWYDAQASVVLRVPSVIMPDTVYSPTVCNYLVNGRHPRLADVLRVVDIEAISVDWRLR